jgi:hypothetical protein
VYVASASIVPHTIARARARPWGGAMARGTTTTMTTTTTTVVEARTRILHVPHRCLITLHSVEEIWDTITQYSWWQNNTQPTSLRAHPRDVVVPPAQQTGAYSSRALDAQASTDRVRVHASTFDSVALMQWHSGHPTGQVTPSPVSASMSRMENAVVVVGAPVRNARMASDGRTGETS